MFIELFFVAALNMSLPEFQPQEDLSGNYIVGTYDVSNDEVIVEEIPVEDFGGLSADPQQEDDPILDQVPLLRSDSNYLNLSLKRNTEIKSENGSYFIRTRSSYNYYIEYVLLSSGVTYNIDSYGNIYTGSSIDYDSEVFLYSNNTITPSNDIYLIQYHLNNYYMNVSISQSGSEDPSGNDPEDPSGNDPEDPSGNDPSGNDPPDNNISADLTNVENKLDNIITLQKSVLLVLLVSFLFPIIISCVKLLKGGKDV